LRWNITADRRITRGPKQNEDERTLEVSVTGTHDTSPKRTTAIVDNELNEKMTKIRRKGTTAAM